MKYEAWIKTIFIVATAVFVIFTVTDIRNNADLYITTPCVLSNQSSHHQTVDDLYNLALEVEQNATAPSEEARLRQACRAYEHSRNILYYGWIPYLLLVIVLLFLMNMGPKTRTRIRNVFHKVNKENYGF